MCSEAIFEVWQAKAIEELVGIPNVKIACLIVNDNATDEISTKLHVY